MYPEERERRANEAKQELEEYIEKIVDTFVLNNKFTFADADIFKASLATMLRMVVLEYGFILARRGLWSAYD